VGGVAAIDEDEFRFPLAEQRESIAFCLVAEVVGVPAEGVDGVEIRAKVLWEQERGDGEVLVVGLG
jgi:hypothetical protein